MASHEVEHVLLKQEERVVIKQEKASHMQDLDEDQEEEPLHSQVHEPEEEEGPPHSQAHDSEEEGRPSHSQAHDTEQEERSSHSQANDEDEDQEMASEEEVLYECTPVVLEQEERVVIKQEKASHMQDLDEDQEEEPLHSQVHEPEEEDGPSHLQAHDSEEEGRPSHSQAHDTKQEERPSHSQANDEDEDQEMASEEEVLYECSICKFTSDDPNYILYQHKCGNLNTAETNGSDGKDYNPQVVTVYNGPTSPAVGYPTSPAVGYVSDENLEDPSYSGNVWTHNEVSLLLGLYQRNKPLFDDPLVKKYKLWRKIGNILKKSPEICDKKFRNMKTRYKGLKNLDFEAGKGRKKWEYFDLMHELLSEDPVDKPSNVVTPVVEGQENTPETNSDEKKFIPPPLVYNDPTSPLGYVSDDDCYEDKNGMEYNYSGNVWLNKEVPLLLELYRQHRSLFSSPRVKKRDVWRKIGNILKKPPESCDKKFRDMKTRFKAIKAHQYKGGKGRKKWEYFDTMKELLSDEPAIESLCTITHHPQGDPLQGPVSLNYPVGFNIPVGCHIPGPVGSHIPGPVSPTPIASTSGEPSVFSAEEIMRKCKLHDSPEWFRDIWLDQTRRLEKISVQHKNILQIQKEMIEVQKVRNLILQDINKLLFKNNS